MKVIYLFFIFCLGISVIGISQSSKGINFSSAISLESLREVCEGNMSKKTNFNKEVFFKYYITSQAQNNSFHQYNACRLLRLIELENNQSKNVLFYDSLSILFAKKAGLKDSLFKSYYNYSIDLLGVNKTLSAQKIINANQELKMDVDSEI